MLISESRKFIFVHIQKTGGTSLKHVIRTHVEDAHPLLGTHDFARGGRRALGAAWDEYFSFAFVRNPWDRLVSWWSMIAQAGSKTDGKNDRNQFWHYVRENGRTFEEFITNCTEAIPDRDGSKCAAVNQYDYLVDESGRCIVGFVGRFETLSDDVATVLKRLGLPATELPHRTRSRHRPYAEYYTPALRDMVGERFARDIERFGYRFGETADRHAAPDVASAPRR